MIRALTIDTLMLRNLPPAEPIQEAAAALRAGFAGFSDSVSSIRNKWAALDSLYTAPEREQVLQAMDTPSRHAEDQLENASAVVDTLTAFAAELAEIDAARKAVQQEVEAEDQRLRPIVEEIESEGNWKLAHGMWDDARDLLQAKITALEDRYELARAACQAALQSVSRASSHVVSTYDSPHMDLETEAAADLATAFRKANGPGASPEDVAGFYRLLADMGPAQVAAFVASEPAAALFTKGLNAYPEASFWKSLSPAQRDGLAVSLPALVGNLEGVAYAVRDRANRRVLEKVMSPGYGASEEQMRAYKSILAALQSHDRQPRTLISFEPAPEHPLAAIAVGDLETSDNATFLVPGMNNYSTDMVSLVSDANLLLKEQRKASDPNVAVVAYMGYETPGTTGVIQDGHATRGAQGFADALDGLYLSRTADGFPAPDVNVVAHSYGTHMVTQALDETLYPITTAVYIGSAGVDEGVVSDDLNIDRGWDGKREIYLTTADKDYFAPIGIGATHLEGSLEQDHRADPATEHWGGRLFSSDGATIDGRDYTAAEGHPRADYFAKDSSSLRGIVMATTGQGRELMEKSVAR